MTEYIYANLHIDNPTNILASLGTAFAGLLLLGFLAQRISEYVDLPVLSFAEYLWHGIVSAAPAWLVQSPSSQVSSDGSTSTVYAAKSQTIRSIFGLDRVGSGVSGSGLVSNAPKGLGNWDNSCYQNSILQALSSAPSVLSFLLRYNQVSRQTAGDTTTQDLASLIIRLNDPSTTTRYLWTPPRLKSMNSWQQQDAQEYYARIADEVEKEFVKLLSQNNRSAGFKSLERLDRNCVALDNSKFSGDLSNPMEGLLAQRVGCTACGYVEGLSLIPFTSITLPLSNLFACDVADCLDEFTALEKIEGVECLKCTLLQARQQLLEDGDPGPAIISCNSVVDEVNETVDPPVFSNRLLQTIEDAIADEDFTEATIAACKIPKLSHVASTKTRQATVMRPPQCLALHFNRSMFDEMTGDLRKNYATTTYPKTLSLGRWIVGSGAISGVMDLNEVETWTGNPVQSILPAHDPDISQDSGPFYHLCAVVTHFGRHENGHYVCFRRMPLQEDKDTPLKSIETFRLEPQDQCCDTAEPQWWRISDEKVLAVPELDALAQEGAFMLFYERCNGTNSEEPVPLTKQGKEGTTLRSAGRKIEESSDPLSGAITSEISDGELIVSELQDKFSQKTLATAPQSEHECDGVSSHKHENKIESR